MKWSLLAVSALSVVVLVAAAKKTTKSKSSRDTWAVLVCSSRYWFNYRHLTNTLSIYRTIKQLGVQDDHIILMNSLDSPCNSRNPFPGSQFSHPGALDEASDLFGGADIEVDYQGEEARVESFLNVLTGRHYSDTPRSKRLESNANSSVLIFLSGHGGDEFFKFHDSEEFSAQDLGAAIRDMELKKRYREILLLADTCQASTLAAHITSPRVTTITSSSKGENSFAYHASPDLGVAAVDRFTLATMQFFQKHVVAGQTHPVPLNRYVSSLDARFLYSTPSAQQSPDSRPLHRQDLRAFFGDGSGEARIVQSSVEHVDEGVVDQDVDEDGTVETYDDFLKRRAP